MYNTHINFAFSIFIIKTSGVARLFSGVRPNLGEGFDGPNRVQVKASTGSGFEGAKHPEANELWRMRYHFCH